MPGRGVERRGAVARGELLRAGGSELHLNSRQRDDCVFLSELVEVSAFAFLAAELDDAAEGAIGGVADQPKTTATAGAPLHAILPSLQFANPPDDARTRRADVLLRDVLDRMPTHTRFKRDSRQNDGTDLG